MDNKDNIFDEAGRQTPYTVPEGFFENMQQSVRERLRKKTRQRRLITLAAAMSLAAAMAGLVFLPTGRQEIPVTAEKQLSAQQTEQPCRQVQQPVQQPLPTHLRTTPRQTTQPAGQTSPDNWIEELSDDELEAMASQADDDVFLN
jgi:hypothetical protein